MADHEVNRLVHVAAGPHDHHEEAHAMRRFVLVVAEKLRRTCKQKRASEGEVNDERCVNSPSMASVKTARNPIVSMNQLTGSMM